MIIKFNDETCAQTGHTTSKLRLGRGVEVENIIKKNGENHIKHSLAAPQAAHHREILDEVRVARYACMLIVYLLTFNSPLVILLKIFSCRLILSMRNNVMCLYTLTFCSVIGSVLRSNV